MIAETRSGCVCSCVHVKFKWVGAGRRAFFAYICILYTRMVCRKISTLLVFQPVYSIFTQCLNLYLLAENGWEKDKLGEGGRRNGGRCARRGEKGRGKEKAEKNDIIVSEN